MIKAEIVAHSKNHKGDELISFLVTFPRIILPEVLTHRMFSRNTSSSRAIPFEKMVEVIKNNPFIPVAFQKSHKGMQGYEYFGLENFNENRPLKWDKVCFEDDEDSYDDVLRAEWNFYINETIEHAERLNSLGVTKQLCNRLLEPFSWTKMLITTSKEGLDNFFDLRCPNYNGYKSWKQLCNMDINYILETPLLDRLKISKSTAEIHIQLLAESMYDAYIESKPRELPQGEWHIPFREKILEEYPEADEKDRIQISTSMAARVSYTTIEEGKKISLEKHRELYQLLIEEKHNSPLEHCAKSIPEEEYENFDRYELDIYNDNPDAIYGWCDNFKGFASLRSMIRIMDDLHNSSQSKTNE